jgi:hypothetical protein
MKRRAESSASGVSNSVIGAAESVYASILLWPSGPTGAVVRACFWNGSDSLQRTVIQSDAAWAGAAAITVDYFDPTGQIRKCVDASSGDIRIALDNTMPGLDYGPGREASTNWSTVGRQANYSPPFQPGSRYKVTVNLPDVFGQAQIGNWEGFNFLVRHEFGHARGLLHEHQRQICANSFDVEAIAASQKWTIEDAKQAVAAFDQLPNAMNFYRPKAVGEYDKTSIMQYNFASNWYKETGVPNPCQRPNVVSAPSPGDIATLIAMYGAAPAASMPPMAAVALNAPPVAAAAPAQGTAPANAAPTAPSIPRIAQASANSASPSEIQRAVEAFKSVADTERRMNEVVMRGTGTPPAAAAVPMAPTENAANSSAGLAYKANEALNQLESATRKLVDFAGR